MYLLTVDRIVQSHVQFFLDKEETWLKGPTLMLEAKLSVLRRGSRLATYMTDINFKPLCLIFYLSGVGL
jgi:hypothetical protein